MQRLSYRQYLMMRFWIKEKWNKPDRTDYYLMRIAQRCQQIMRDDPGKVTIDHQKVDFVFKSKVPVKLTPEQKKQQLAIAKLRWKWALGIGVKHAKRR